MARENGCTFLHSGSITDLDRSFTADELEKEKGFLDSCYQCALLADDTPLSLQFGVNESIGGDISISDVFC